MNIYEKLLAISNDLLGVAKNLEVRAGKGSYKAVGEADILKAVKPLEKQYGVYSYPLSRRIIESGKLESTDFNGASKHQLYERIEVTYRFVNIEKPDEFVDMASYGDGIDSGDKGPGKAMTYADKYALMKAYKIITGDDPDQFASEDLNDAEITPADPTPDKPIMGKPTDESLRLAVEMGVDLQKLAIFYKVGYGDLTEEMVRCAIDAKKKAREKAVAK